MFNRAEFNHFVPEAPQNTNIKTTKHFCDGLVWIAFDAWTPVIK